MNNDETILALVKEIKDKCLKNNAKIATAESCTGGLIGGAITSEPGISACYPGGIVSYANEVKNEILEVSSETLSTVGAVSPECAKQMAEGVRKLFNVNSAVAVTGIAGPDGGTAQKPVGLVYIATASSNGTIVEKNIFCGNRSDIRRATVKRALELLLSAL